MDTHRRKFLFWAWKFHPKNRNFSNSIWRRDGILKIVFWLYLGAILADYCKFRNVVEKSHANIGRVINTAIFANSRWRTAAILKIALSPYLSRELSDFDQIWYADANFHPEDGYLTKNRFFFKFKMADERHIENRFRRLTDPDQLMWNSEWRRWITCKYRSRGQKWKFS